MTSRRQNLIARIESLPEELLPEVELSLDDVLNWHDGIYRLDDEERAAIRRGAAAADRGEFVSDQELAELRARHRV